MLSVTPEQAFTSYTTALHQWRKFPFLDPGLPVEVLPPDWPGRIALELFTDLRTELEPLAMAYAASVVATRQDSKRPLRP